MKNVKIKELAGEFKGKTKDLCTMLGLYGCPERVTGIKAQCVE